LVWISSYTAYL